MRVKCPLCGAKGNLDESRRPPGAAVIRCPRCKGSIPVSWVLDGPVSARREGIVSPHATGAATDRAKAPTGISGVEPVDRQSCSVCNRPFPRKEMVMFGPAPVCASCRPTYLQSLEQGGVRPGSLSYAGFWPRFCAKFIDMLVLAAVMGASYIAITPQGTKTEVVSTAMAIWSAAVAVLSVAMGTCFVGRFGATPGKMALGLVVVNPEGDRIRSLRALGRCLAELLSGLFFCIGYLLMLFDAEKRTLHDMICGTRVIYK